MSIDSEVVAAPQRPADERAAAGLLRWLYDLVEDRNVGYLADLRRLHADSVAKLLAGNFAAPGGVALGPQAVEIFERVAFLFTRFHAGETALQRGSGSLGYAMSKVGSADRRGSENPGCVRLLNQILVSRQPPFRRIQHGIDLIRSDSGAPPNWFQLTVDLLRWTDSERTVQRDWARDFYLPHTKSRRMP
ncbi:type I-E CRISPR-associated protein Cse2/CasB [Nocardia yunnanensis]|uniref:type I-E CRISPR-associated protein Cse2/CasB n=1 Tax=Nocardia yunnanensis TaxID=2382165 RepID=UPI0013C5124A|nr:type I-E CRISPR-associated protein Cse2/CasB [Nocardia yunnanensis]